MSLRRYITSKQIKGVVLATCHTDVLEWLQPDWVFSTAKGKFLPRRSERPEIRVTLSPCSWKEWPAFSDHHYLSGEINKGSRCWIAEWRGEQLAFAL